MAHYDKQRLEQREAEVKRLVSGMEINWPSSSHSDLLLQVLNELREIKEMLNAKL